jgi:hypothetical protein
MLVRVDPSLLVMEIACCLMTVMMLRAIRPRVKAMVLHVMMLKIAPTSPSTNEAMRCDERYHIWNVMGGLSLFEFE